jgi:membrane-associated phospholipid phosphatase
VNKVAKILSYIFDGSFISIPIIIIICFMVVGNKAEAFSWAFTFLLFGTVIPYLYVALLYRRKRIDDIHIPKREDRIKPLLVSIASYGLCLVILYVLNGPLFLKSIFAVILISTIVFTIITYFWKISLHTGWVTFVVITFNILFGRWMLLMVPLIPVIGWARVRIKKHTIKQVIFGAGVSTITSFIIYYNYGFINIFQGR